MKKVVIEINFNEDNISVDELMHSIHDVFRGHAPYVDNDIVLGTDVLFDGEVFKGDKVFVSADFNSKNVTKHGIMSDMLMGSMIPILNGITNGDKSNGQ